MMYWLLENRDEADRMKTKGMIEVPDPGYTGSLKGTSWDPDTMIDDYNQ